MDAVATAIMNNRFNAIVEEASTAIYRTAHTTFVKLTQDYATAIATPEGDIFAYPAASGAKNFVGLPLQATLDLIGRDTLRPGDCIITNDPEIGSGHLPDITMAAPIFYRDRLVGFSGSIAHLPDIGGAGWAGDCRELVEEGLRLMPVKFIEGGRENTYVTQLIRHNVRAADQVIGDIYAQVSAQRVCAAGVCQFLDDTGMEDLVALSTELRQRAENAMRAAIDSLPDGSWISSIRADGFDDDRGAVAVGEVLEPAR